MPRQTYPKDYVPWPDEAEAPYKKLIALYKQLAEDINTSINRGTRARVRSKPMLEALIDYIIEGCQEIDKACQEICNCLEDERKGRYPKWYSLTVSVQNKILEILFWAEKVKPALAVNKLPYLVDVYDRMKVELDKAKELIDEYPYRKAKLAPCWDEVAQKVNEAFKK